ncbi:conserved hypothetical protein [Luminiphilus syltensis NOR5-1B]|uniref:Outer membrane lipoprotein carrier protein LolA n=1 Tax=Luminiphilus syltensis NOR5-1B TaxID=565045 RepID=B8KU32_9GAMM|nr:outer-membrane lipoprotein carrier protein LolA [Luminiphilus syltensis]EED35267.1 conserved hypothetical protein [Luminiphilus syltensis NOR5-1B]
MNTLYRFFALALLATCTVQAHAEDPTITWELKDAIRQIDRQADDFESVMAHVVITRSNTADATGSETEEKGVIFANKQGDTRIVIESPQSLVYLLDHRDLYRYIPEQEVVEEYYLPKHPQLVAPFLRLGFSTTGKDLEDDFLVSAIGERMIGDRRTLGLDLTPKKEKDRNRVVGMKIWIDQASWMPVEQVIESAGNGQVMTVMFSNMARNLKLNPDLFKRKWPRGTDKKKIR